MPKFTVEKIIVTSYKQTVEAKNIVSAMTRAKRKTRDWRLDNQTEEWNVEKEDGVDPIGFGRQ